MRDKSTDKRNFLIGLGLLGLLGIVVFRQPVSKGVDYLLMTVRGYRNNNPLNIRYNPANNWQGQTGHDADGFAQFSTPVYGYRAAGKILLSYQNRGLDSVRKMISTWAPPTENPTDAYINMVARDMGVNPDAPVNLTTNPVLFAKMLVSMTKMESGANVFADSLAISGVKLAIA